MIRRLFEKLLASISWGLSAIPGLAYLINLEQMARRVINAEMTEFLIFVGAACILGAYSLWGPILIGWYVPTASANNEFIKVLDAGQGYSFGISLLGVAFSYIFREYHGGKDSEFKTLKTRATWIALGVLLVLIVLKTMDTAGRIMLPHSPPVSDANRVVQTCLLVVAFYFSVVMFCIQKIDAYPEAGVELRDKLVQQMTKKMSSARHSKIKV